MNLPTQTFTFKITYTNNSPTYCRGSRQYSEIISIKSMNETEAISDLRTIITKTLSEDPDDITFTIKPRN